MLRSVWHLIRRGHRPSWRFHLYSGPAYCNRCSRWQ